MPVYLTNQRVNVGTFDSGPQPYSGSSPAQVSLKADPVPPQNSNGQAVIELFADKGDGQGLVKQIEFDCVYGTFVNPRTGQTVIGGSSIVSTVDTFGWQQVEVTCTTTNAPCLLSASTT